MYPSVRKVHTNGNTVVGRVPSRKGTAIQFESALEMDFIYLLQFDSDVGKIFDQPVKIDYVDDTGKAHTYVPDFLVEYRNRTNVLFEVKYAKDLRKNRKLLKPKFEAAKQFALSRDWEFRTINEKQIIRPYTENAKFLLPYHDFQADEAVTAQLLDALGNSKSTPNLLIRSLSNDPNVWPSLIGPLWSLVVQRKISCNLFKPLNMNSPVWKTTSKGFVELNFPYTK